MRRVLVVAIALRCVPFVARGQDRWRAVAISADSSQWSYDTLSLRRSGPKVTVWLRTAMAKPDTMRNGQWVQSFISYTTIDCDDRTTMMTDDVYYALDGTIARQHHNPAAQPEPIIPGSVLESIHDALCAIKSKK